MSRRWFSSALAACLVAMSLVSSIGSAAVAQAPATPPAEKAPAETPPAAPEDATAAEAEAKPEPIAAADIAPQAETISARLREFTKLAEPIDQTAEISKKLPETTQEIQRLAGDLTANPPVSLRAVATDRQHWASLDGVLDGWQKTLQKRLTALQEAIDEIESHGGIWKITQSDTLPETVQQQIDTVLSDLEKTLAAVKARSKDVLTLQGQLSKQRDSASKALDRLDEIAGSQRSRLFARNQDPLWRALGGDREPLGTEVAKSRSTIAAAVSEFIARYKTHAALHAVLFVFLIALIWLTRRAVSTGMMSDREVDRVSLVLARPFSTALLVSILLLKLIYPVASAEILQLQRLVLMIPVLRLLPTLLPKYRWMFIALALMFVVETAAGLAVDGSLLQRLALLAATALAVVALGVGLAEDRRRGRAGDTRIAPVIRVLAWLGALGLVASLAANVWGAIALASLLGSATTNAIWAAVVLRVAINVLSALFILVLRSPVARTLKSVRDSGALIHRRVVSVLGFGAVLLWIGLVLTWLQLWQPLLAWTRASLEHEWVIGTLQVSASAFVAFILVIVIATVVSRLIRFFLAEDILSRLDMPRGAPATISTVVHYTIIGIGVVIAFAASGLDLSKLGFIVGALGVGIGFGLQSIVNNFVSGLILIAERPIKVGDLIELTGTKGHVTRIGARASTIRTFAGAASPALREAGIEVPRPQREVLLRRADEERSESEKEPS